VQYHRKSVLRPQHEFKVSLPTDRKFLNNDFILVEVRKDITDESQIDAITMKDGMGTIISFSETIPCTLLSLPNGDSYLALCKSGFLASSRAFCCFTFPACQFLLPTTMLRPCPAASFLALSVPTATLAIPNRQLDR